MDSKRPREGIASIRRREVKKLFKGLGKKIYSDIEEGKFPEIIFPSRSVRNIVYDEGLKQYILGNTSVKRSTHNIKHIRPFTQLIWLAFFVNKLVEQSKTSTLRDVFYSAQAYGVEFVDQAESDEIITDLEAVLSRAREDFNVYPEERSAIFGDLTIEYTVPGYEGKRLNLASHPDGYLIGPSLSTADFIDTSAEMVLAVEKGGLFTRFVEEKVHKRYKALVIDTAGQPPRSTRYMLKRLNHELGLPVYVLTDGDVYGEHIAMVIISGSVQREEPIVLRNEYGSVEIRKIGEFVDECFEKYGYFYNDLGYAVSVTIPYKVLTVDDENQVRFKPISSVIRHRHKGSFYLLKTESGRSVIVTPNHSVFILKGENIVSIPTSEIKHGDLLVIVSNVCEPTRPTLYIDVVKELGELPKDVTSELYVVLKNVNSRYHKQRRLETFTLGKKRPHLGQSSDISYIKCKSRGKYSFVPCPTRIWLTKQLARLLGYYTSKGYLSRTPSGRPSSINLTFGLDELEVVEDAEKCIRAVFPNSRIRRYTDNEGSAVTISFGGIPTALLFFKLCGSGHANKFVPKLMFSVDKEYILEYLKGCFSDGYVTNSGALCWKMKNPWLISELAYLMTKIGVTASISEDGTILEVSGKSEVEKLVTTVLHQDDQEFVIQYISSIGHSSYRMPKAFPIIASGLLQLKKEICRHQYHELRCKLTYRRLCEVFRSEKEGGIDRSHIVKTLEHILSCKVKRPSFETNLLIKKILGLALSDLSFDPVAKIEQIQGVDEYVYDVSVPEVERFIGGRSGLLLHNSANAAHLRELTVPSGKWIGVWGSDIVKYKLPSNSLTDLDIKRVHELKRDPRYKGGVWQRELDVFLKIKKKSELEAFAKYGLTTITDKYLPEKLDVAKSL